MGGPGSGGKNQYWTDELLESELRKLCAAIGKFPSAQDMKAMGRNDIACTIGKRGGFVFWSDKLGIARAFSDSDLGWAGEAEVSEKFTSEGIECLPSGKGVKSPYDLIAANCLRIDVKTANRAEYNSPRHRSIGWYYRIGKAPQADLVILYRRDIGDFFGVPWWACSTSNVSIGQGEGRYWKYRNNWPLIRQMIGMRLAERARFGMKVAEVA